MPICQRVKGRRKPGDNDKVQSTERESNRISAEVNCHIRWYCPVQICACNKMETSAEKLENMVPAQKDNCSSVQQSEETAKTPEPPFSKIDSTKPSVYITGSWGGRKFR